MLTVLTLTLALVLALTLGSGVDARLGPGDADGRPAPPGCRAQTLTIHHPSYDDTWRVGAHDNRLAFTVSPLCGGGDQLLRLFNLDGSLDGSEWSMRIDYAADYVLTMDAGVALPASASPRVVPKKGYYLGLTMGDSLQLANTNVSHEFEVVRSPTWAEQRDWVSAVLGAAAACLLFLVVLGVHAGVTRKWKWKWNRRIQLPPDEDLEAVRAGLNQDGEDVA